MKFVQGFCLVWEMLQYLSVVCCVFVFFFLLFLHSLLKVSPILLKATEMQTYLGLYCTDQCSECFLCVF